MLRCIDNQYSKCIKITEYNKNQLSNHTTTTPQINPKIHFKFITHRMYRWLYLIFMSKHSCFFSCRKVIYEFPPYNKKSISSLFKAENAHMLPFWLAPIKLYVSEILYLQQILWVSDICQIPCYLVIVVLPKY